MTYVCWTVHQEENTSVCAEINTTAVCNRNGVWELDSLDKCSIFSAGKIILCFYFRQPCMHDLIPIKGSRLSDSLSQDGKIAVASSVTIFTIVSILFFTIGFLCGHICQKKRKRAEILPPSEQTQIPYYDDVVLQQPDEQELELKENVAYDPVR